NSELPGSHCPSAPRRRELLATRNFITSCAPTWRRLGSLTMFPTTVAGVSNIAHSFPEEAVLLPATRAIPVTPHRLCRPQSARRYRQPATNHRPQRMSLCRNRRVWITALLALPRRVAARQF